jgi:hypothetical protein
LVGWLGCLLLDWEGISSSWLFFKVVTLHIIIFYSFIITEMFKSCAVCVGTLFYVTHVTSKASTHDEQPICEPKENISSYSLSMMSKHLILTEINTTETCGPRLTANWNSGKHLLSQ